MDHSRFFEKLKDEVMSINAEGVVTWLSFRYVDSRAAAEFMGYKSTTSIRNLVRKGYLDEVGNRHYLTDHDGRYDLIELSKVRELVR